MLPLHIKEIIKEIIVNTQSYYCIEHNSKNVIEIFENIKNKYNTNIILEKTIKTVKEKLNIKTDEFIKVIKVKNDIYIILNFKISKNINDKQQEKYLFRRFFLLYNHNSIKNTLIFLKELMDDNIIDFTKEKTQKVDI